MNMDFLEKHILQLETDLITPEIRQSMEKTGEWLSDEFVEFCSSGNIWHYKKGEPVDGQMRQIDWEIKDFAILQLHDDCVLATYKLVKHSEESESKKYSLRSSIWKCFDGRWKMLFHQGTPTTKF